MKQIEMRRCPVCEVTRPAFMFSSKGGDRKHHHRSNCRGCNSSNKQPHSPRMLKKAGESLEVIQRVANDRCDAIADKMGLPRWRPDKHRSELERVSAPPLSGVEREKIISELAAQWLKNELARGKTTLSHGGKRAAERRARAAAVKQLTAAEKEQKRLAKIERKRIALENATPVQLIEDSFKKSVRAFRRAQGRATQNKRKRASGTVVRVKVERPPAKVVKCDLRPADVSRMIVRSNLRCEVTGVEFDMRDPDIFKPRYAFSPSVDQIVPGRGYTRGNTRLVAYVYNILKNDTDDDSARANLMRMAASLKRKLAA